MKPHRAPRMPGLWGFIFVILLYYGAALWFTIRLPALATPNELLNFEYVQVMRQIGGLPNRGLVDSEVRYTEWHQPPFYFVFAALAGLSVPVQPALTNPPPPIDWPSNPAYLSTHRGNLNPVVHISPTNMPLLYTSRMAAALLGIVGLAALFRAGRFVLGSAVALLMVSLLAFQPNYLHLSASVNNDMPLTAVSAMVMACAILLVARDRPPIWYTALGLLAAAAILTKASGVFVLAYLGMAWLLVTLRYHDLVRTIKTVFFSLVGLLPFWVAWLALNTIRMNDTLGVQGSLPVERVLALRPGAFALLLPWLDNIWRSFWLDWSAGDVGLGPDWYYLIWAALLLVALFGWFRRPPERARWATLALVTAGILAISYLYFAVKALTVKEAGYLVAEGRWWLPVLPGLVWLAAGGFARWWSPGRRTAAVLAAALLPIISTFLLMAILFPALYPRATPLRAAELPAGAAIYDQRLALVDVDTGPLTISEETELTLTWQALSDVDQDLLVAVQLLAQEDGRWRKLDEQYSYPGLGLDPTGDWREGDRYQDVWTLRPVGALDGPTLAHVAVQVRQGGRNLSAAVNGRLVDPPLALDVTVRPPEPLSPPASLNQPVSFGSAIELVAQEITATGPDLRLTLWWHAIAEPGQDLVVFAHALDDQGQLLVQNDGKPAGGASPTSIWAAGDIIRDVRSLPGASAAATLVIGLYDASTGERLTAGQGGQILPDHAYRMDVEP